MKETKSEMKIEKDLEDDSISSSNVQKKSKAPVDSHFDKASFVIL